MRPAQIAAVPVADVCALYAPGLLSGLRMRTCRGIPASLARIIAFTVVPAVLRLNPSRSKRFMGRAIAAAPCAGLSYGALP